MTVFLAQMDRYDDHMDWNDGGSWWMFLTMVLFGIALIGVIVWAVIATTRHTQHANELAPRAPAPTPTSNARAILDERLARGEIDAAEYEERRRLLG